MNVDWGEAGKKTVIEKVGGYFKLEPATIVYDRVTWFWWCVLGQQYYLSFVPSVSGSSIAISWSVYSTRGNMINHQIYLNTFR